MKRPCRCDRIDPSIGASYSPDQCRACWNFWHDDRYRRLWSDAPQVSGGCVHRASKAHRFAACDCPSGLPIFRCNCPHVGGECCVDANTDSRRDVVDDQGLSVCDRCRHAEHVEGEAMLPTVAYPCRHRQRSRKWVDIGSCDGKLVEVFPCSLTGKECALEHQVPGAAVCAACSYRAPVVAQAAFVEEEVEAAREELEGPTRRRAREWALRPAVIEAHRRAFHDVASQPHPYPGGFAGDGIVTLGGGLRYFPSAYVLCRLLRHLGCDLPIEWWMLDDHEYDDDMRRVAESVPGVTVVNAKDRVGHAPRCWGGWQAKVWSIMHSRFARVLFLDSDQLPTKDPTYLFEQPGFLRTGAMAWQDFHNHMSCRVHAAAFRTAGLPVPGRSRMPSHPFPSDFDPQETGQFLCDKSRVWHALNVAKWHSDHSDYFYHLGYGDTTQWLLSFAVSGVDYVVAPPCQWTGDGSAGAFLQPDEHGSVVLQHRCQPAWKLSLTRPNLPFPEQVHYEEMLRFLEELKSMWGGRMHECQPNSAMAGSYVARTEQGESLVRLTEAGDVQGLVRGARRWGESKGRLVLKRQDGTAVAIASRNGRTWSDRDAGVHLAMRADLATHDHEGDRILVRDVLMFNEYRLRPDLSQMSVLDVGANQGFFAQACVDRGASRVVCYEPADVNLKLLEQNLGDDSRVEIVHAALGRSDERERVATWSRPYRGEQSGGIGLVHTTTASIEGECVVLPFDEAIYGQWFDLLKIDCEGYEWPILFSSNGLHQIRSIVGEWHLDRKDLLDPLVSDLGYEVSLEGLRSLLTSHGFSVKIEHTIPGTLGHFWAWRGERHPCCEI